MFKWLGKMTKICENCGQPKTQHKYLHIRQYGCNCKGICVGHCSGKGCSDYKEINIKRK
jgi:hypothetical protein